jgi:hypothetical protein
MTADVVKFLRSLLNPEENGWSVQPHVRDEARRLLGLTPCEGEPMAAIPFVHHQRVKVGSVPGWVEVIEPTRIGVRFVNGNFRWADPVAVQPDAHNFGNLSDDRP